jgi:hypothetical protein
MYDANSLNGMSSDVARDMKWSAKLFCEQVWPLIQQHLDGGELLKMEGRPDIQLANQLDMKAGIDGWHIHGEGMRGIASRVQETDDPWNTFTVRMSRDSGAITEFEKRKLAIQDCDRGWIFPAITVQAYVATKEGPILSCGIARTSDIIAFVTNDLHYIKSTSNAQFAVCSWKKMQSQGYKVKIISPTASTAGDKAKQHADALT